MFRARHRPENNARPTAPRGSVGSARVWDERTRALRVAAGTPDRSAAPLGPAPDELAALIQGIVRVTLDTRLTELERPRRAALAAELERRLLEAFGRAAEVPRVELTPAQESPQVAEQEPARIPPPVPASECEEPVHVDEPAPPPAPHAAHLRALALVLEDRLARLGGRLATSAQLRRLLAELTLAAPVEGAPPSAAGVELLRSLDVLERRANKLERALYDARAALAYVSGLERVDPGLASIYRHVQGLAHDDPRREQKAGALAKIYQANLELRQRRQD
jgi:hypothetical protein